MDRRRIAVVLLIVDRARLRVPRAAFGMRAGDAGGTIGRRAAGEGCERGSGEGGNGVNAATFDRGADRWKGYGRASTAEPDAVVRLVARH